MALLPASRVVVPATARSIFCVISPFALILRVPPTTPSVLPSMSSSPFAFVSADVWMTTAALSTNPMFPNAWFPLVPAFMVTELEKALLAWSRTIFDPVAPTTKVDAPVTANTWPCVMLPVVAVMLRVPPTAPSVPASMSSSPSAFVSADVWITTAALSTNPMFPNARFPLVPAFMVTELEKALLAWSRTIFDVVVPTMNVDAPVMIRAPVFVISPAVAVTW